MDRIEESNRNGKDFIFINLSGLKTGEEFSNQFNLIKPVISKYKKLSLNIITNIADIRIDAEIKDMVLDLLKHNKPYIKCSVVIGMDGIKKMMLSTMIKLCGRDDVFYVFTKEKAIDLILQQP